MNSPSSPIFCVLSSLFQGDQSILLVKYDDERIFFALWSEGLTNTTFSIGEDRLNWTDGRRRVLIVGSRPPEVEGLRYREHFTALHWLAAWRLKFPKAPAHIAVYDPALDKPSRGAVLALRTLFSLEIAGATGRRKLVPGTAVLAGKNSTVIREWLRKIEDEEIQTPEAASGLLRSTLWDALTANRDDHHAVSNVLGAFLLRSQVSPSGDNPASPDTGSLLLSLARACGAPVRPGAMRGKRRTCNDGSGPWLEKTLRSQIPGALVIDDMADLWSGFIGGALGLPTTKLIVNEAGKFDEVMLGDPAPKAEPGRNGLCRRLEDFLESGRRFLVPADLIPARRRERGRTPENFVLFLDLRLGLEPGFFKSLAAVGRKLLQASRPLPWVEAPGKKEGLCKEFARLRPQSFGDSITVAEPGDSRPEQTLLPRLLSLLDPTLPIVIFSSTHRTELIDPLRDYSNVITTFRKPMLSGLDRDWPAAVGELRADFVSAMEQAARILRVRRLLRRLSPTKP